MPQPPPLVSTSTPEVGAAPQGAENWVAPKNQPRFFRPGGAGGASAAASKPHGGESASVTSTPAAAPKAEAGAKLDTHVLSTELAKLKGKGGFNLNVTERMRVKELEALLADVEVEAGTEAGAALPEKSGKGVPAAERSVPASIPARTLQKAEAEYVDLIGKTGKEYDKKRELLDAEIVRLREEQEIAEGKGSLGELPEWVEPNRKIKPEGTDTDAKPNYIRPDWLKELSGEPVESPKIESPVKPESAESAQYDSAIEPFSYTVRPEDITAGNLDGGVIDRFSHNATLVLGGDGVTGLIRRKQSELIAQQERYQRGKAKIAGMKEEHGRRGLFGLLESKAVSDARAEVNPVSTEQKSENIKRKKFLEAVGLDEVEDKALLDSFRLWDRVQVEIDKATAQAGGTLTADAEQKLFSRFIDPKHPELMITNTSLDHVDTLRGLQGNLALKTEENKQYSYFHFTEHGWYINEKHERIEGVRVPVHGKKEHFRFQGRQVLEARNAEAQRKLTDAQHREDAVRKAQEGIRRSLPPREKALVALDESLTRIGQFVHERFVPDREELLATITELGTAREALGDLSRMQELGKKHGETITRKTALRLAKLPDEIDDLVNDISKMTDPGERLAECTDLASGLELADQENLDVSRLSRDDQFQLALAQTLLGIPVSVDIKAAAAPEPAGTKPPAEPEAEKPAASVPKPEAGKTAELTPDQVASLPLEVRTRLEREGLLTANQYSGLPVYREIAIQVDQLEQVSGDQLEAALKPAIEAAKSNPQAAEDAMCVEEEMRARVASVIAADTTRGNQQMIEAETRVALEENAKSPDKNIAARAKTALKLLAAVGIITAMASTGGGEQH